MFRRLLAVAVVAACSSGAERPPEATSTELGAPPSSAPSAEEQQLVQQCERGTDAACDQLQARYVKTRRRVESAALVQRLCEGGRRAYCPTYAFVLAEGLGVPRDRARARQLFDETCKDDPTGCSEFGNLYTSGTGVAQDFELGCVLLKHACTHRDEQACGELASCTR